MEIPPPDIHAPAALHSVSNFVATHGWNQTTNGLIEWIDLEPKHTITGIPWTQFADQDLQATTRDGVLYVLIYGFRHDYWGVAYNPKTNRFPSSVRGCRPLGDHWYAWVQPEFQGGPTHLRQEYE